MQLTNQQQEVMDAAGHLLVTGGPGSGKTTIAILKAAKIARHDLRSGQKILFLSFARATVSRVVEVIEFERQILGEEKKRIDVETYHSFFWRLLKTHGYLIGLPRRISILAPPEEAIELSTLRGEYKADSKLTVTEKHEKQKRVALERQRLARKEGRVCFDLFAFYVQDILCKSERICRLIATMYPVIILDEFQDTNVDQWGIVRTLGMYSTLFALADPDQRIYEWLGADPERLSHFKDTFEPTEVNLGGDNHRSAGMEILAFGNDLLTGVFRQGKYDGVDIYCYKANRWQASIRLMQQVYVTQRRLINTDQRNWSVAVLVPTKKMTRFVSDTFRNPPAGMAAISHTAVIEAEAAILGAEAIAFLMQRDVDDDSFSKFVDLLCNYFLGRGGDTPSRKDLQEAARIRTAHIDFLDRQAVGKEIKKNSVLVATQDVYTKACMVDFSGDPARDWREIRRILEEGACGRLTKLALDAKNIRLLDRGAQLRRELSQDWRDNGMYFNALSIIRRAFAREHFSTNVKPETGIVVMNMHKAKGKQFDEVIIFEGWPKKQRGRIVANPDRIVRSNLASNINRPVRQNFRVSATRSKARTTILTPENDPCCILTG